jgi:MFS family permease
MLMLASFVDRLGSALLFPFIAVYVAKHFNATFTQVGVVFAIISISGLVGNGVAGALTDRFGRRSMMIIGLVVSALSSVAFGLVNDLSLLYGLAAVVGLLGAIGWPAQGAMIADLVPEDKRADAYGVARVLENLVFVIGPVIGGLLAPQTGYLLLFVIDAFSSMATAALVFMVLPETKPEKKEGETHETLAQTLAGYRTVARDRLFAAFTLIFLLLNVGYVQMYGTLAVFLTRVRAEPESTYGTIFAIGALEVVVFQFAITRRISNRPPMLMMVLGALLYAIGLAMYGFVTTPFLYGVAMVVIVIGEMITVPVAQALVARFAPEDMRGRYMAAGGFAWIIPQAAAPLLAGRIMDTINPVVVWYVSGSIGVVAAAGFYALHLRGGARIGGVVERGVEVAPIEPVAAG